MLGMRGKLRVRRVRVSKDTFCHVHPEHREVFQEDGNRQRQA